MSTVEREKQILRISFFAGLGFALAELGFAIYSHSQSALMDAVYDSTELIFIALILYLTPLFHKPISEKRPYGFFQVESIFLIIKGFMMLSVTLGVSVNVIQSALSGGNPVNGGDVSLFQLVQGIGCVIIYFIMKRLNRPLSSPTVEAEILGWKLDIAYSLGLSLAFFVSIFLERTSISWIAPYFDQLMAVLIMLSMLPENIRMLKNAIMDVFLFSPEEETMDGIKKVCGETLAPYQFEPVFYDITRTGRHLWISVYFEVPGESCPLGRLRSAIHKVNQALNEEFENCTCDLILTPKEGDMVVQEQPLE